MIKKLLVPFLFLFLAGLVTIDAANAGLIGYWPMDTNGGSGVADASGNGLDATLNNTDSGMYVSGKINTALHFTGNRDATIASANSLTPPSFTVASYINIPSASGPWQWVAGHGDNYGLVVNESGDTLVYYYNGSGWSGITVDVPDLRDGQWHHIAGSYNASTNTLQAFVDGVLVGSEAGNGNIVYGTGADFHIGSMNGSRYFRGNLDELKVFDQALSENEVAALLVSEIAQLSIKTGTTFEKDSGSHQANIEFVLDHQLGTNVSFDYTTIPVSAIDGEDFQGVSGSLTIPAGSLSKTIHVNIISDTDVEPDETFDISISNLNGAEAETLRASYNIRNDDGISYGLNTRPSNTECVAGNPPNSSTDPLVLDLENSFPGMSFNLPLAMKQSPGDNSRFYIVEVGGKIKVIENGILQSTPFLDISNNIGTREEDGLYSIAFHPNYANNGLFYISFVDANEQTRIDRYHVSANPNIANASSRFTILERSQPYRWHNNYHIDFGTDGYLYISMGDGGSGGDPDKNAQDTSTWLGSMLRIDVDGGSPYAIPPDNPFAGQSCNQSSRTGNCPEIYAWGIRSPWRWSFDRQTQDLWLGDVGQSTEEEVDIIEKGKNYGWSCREGSLLYNSSHCTGETMVSPVATYQHTNGKCSVTGGYVYRGNEIPALNGTYLYGDLCTGNVFTLPYYSQPGAQPSLAYSPPTRPDGSDEPASSNDLTGSGYLVSFAEDNAGELYIISYFNGTISKIISNGGGGVTNPNVPNLLSQSHCVQPGDPSQPTASMIPFKVNSAHWADDAHNDNWLAIPDGTTIDHQQGGDWKFPKGSVIMKNFILNQHIIETRFMMLHNNGSWRGYTYEWNAAGTDANRVIGGKEEVIDGQSWIYPSESECTACHTNAAGGALAPETAQLNGPFTYPQTGVTANQLESLEKIGLFSDILPASADGLIQMVDPNDPNEDLQDRAKSWLHTNCSSCHQPGVVTQINIDFRYKTPLEKMNICNVPPQNQSWGITNPMRMAPGDADRSLIFNRPNRLDNGQMPPIGTNSVDSEGLSMIQNWINSLEGCPFSLTTTAINGRITPAEGGFNPGSSAQLSAIPDPGYAFTGWSGDISGTNNPVTVIFDSDKNITANFTVQSTPSTFTLPNNEWHLISPPGPLGQPNTISALFGDDLPLAGYGDSWAMFYFDTANNQYVSPNISDALEYGRGYWIIQNTGTQQVLDVTLADPQSGAQTIQIPLQTPFEVSWNLVGYPFSSQQPWNGFTVKTDSGLCSDANGCTLSEAKTGHIFHDNVWTYNGSTYDIHTATDLTTAWSGFWSATLPDSQSLNPRLEITAP